MYTRMDWRSVPSRRPSAREGGFSVVELMVVAAILSVMISLLLPALGRAKSSADTIKCMGNLRSWGVAFQMHAVEHEGLYPKSFLNNSDNWTLWIAPYVEIGWLTYDPATFAKRLDMNKSGCPFYAKMKHPDPLYKKFPYSYNAGRFDYPYYVHRHIAGQMVDNGIIWGAGWDISDGERDGTAIRYGGGSWGGETHNHIDEYAHLAPTQLYSNPTECEVMFCGIASHWRYYAYPYAHWFSGGGGVDYNVRTGDGAFGVAYDYNQSPQGVHSGKDNYLFMDGHVESLKPKDPLVNYYVYNGIPARGNPWRKFPTPGSSWQYGPGIIPKGIDPYP